MEHGFITLKDILEVVVIPVVILTTGILLPKLFSYR